LIGAFKDTPAIMHRRRVIQRAINMSASKRPKQESVDSFALRSGDTMPKVGLGTWKIPKEITADSIVEAIRVGYRHLDCACDYGNEKEVIFQH
jgi:hypothetical protein